MKERMNIVIVGHVDHGKSTLVGRLLVDTNSLPNGKLEQVKRKCEANSKPFEYAFLLDALIDEQAQGITIDTARIFFKTQKREYIIIDAPGHIEFLKNMISGAARAEAAILLIDAGEGIADNSKRHAYMLSMLGIKQIVVAVNKMDIVNYDEEVFTNIKNEYILFLEEIGIKPIAFVPISARNGINITEISDVISWYNGKTIVEFIDSFTKEKDEHHNNFRMFVQGVYKFTANNDDRRIIAGTIISGSINAGDEIVFLPSGKRARVKSIEAFNKPFQSKAYNGEAIGITLTTQVYVKPSELICRADETPPYTSDRFRANIFWMGKKALDEGKKYKLKIGTNTTEFCIESIENVLDASILENITDRNKIHRHEVAQCILKTKYPISFDLITSIITTSRFVIVDEYDIAGGGIITEVIENELDINFGANYHPFELELNNLIRKHFPHWEVKSLFEK
ncbi:MAG: sulfate adenylyltransferase subunit 1 [Ignavibacteriaceae bacterium]